MGYGSFFQKKGYRYCLARPIIRIGGSGDCIVQAKPRVFFGWILHLVGAVCVFLPAKKGILKELIGTQRLAKAVGFMEMLAMVGILGGAFAGAVVFDQMVENRGGWSAALLVFISILAFISWVIAWPIPDTAVAGTKPFKIPLMVNHFHDLLYLLRRKELRYAALVMPGFGEWVDFFIWYW